ncbi:MAG TPA: purine-nucleoside phosphorylase [Candidatus Kapabacteria bacterium]|nr:purine-nucleoside phosphorylase [Candidatus Kapabacteria bacterium]
MSLREQMAAAADVIRAHAGSDFIPEAGIILGTGLGHLADEIEKIAVVEYADIPGFPLATVESHSGRLIAGHLGGKVVVAMQGRFHYYEGYSMGLITFPVRVMHELGAGTLLVSNACGGMNPLFRRGDLMVIEDHINLLGDNPLIGPNDETLGPRFPDMSEPYSHRLIALAEEVAMANAIRLLKGTYVAVAGPSLETRAEYRFLRAVGADAVGMSTVPEVIVARHMNMNVLGISIITDECFPDSLAPVNVADIIAAANRAEPSLARIMAGVIERM